MDIHNYNGNINGYDETAHGYLNTTGHSTEPLSITEWSTYRQNKCPSVSFAIGNVVANLIHGSAPGNDYVYGSYILSLYNWGT